MKLRIEIDKFHRYGADFYNALLVVANARGDEMVFRVGEYPEKTKISTVFHDASVMRVTHSPSIIAHLENGI